MILMMSLVAQAPAADLSTAVYDALSQRHAPSCTAIAELGDPIDVRLGLVHVATKTTAPPWAPLNAAKCLVPMLDESSVMEVVIGWFDQPSTSGLALVVVQNLDDTTEENATKIATFAAAHAAKDSRFGIYAKRAMIGSKHVKVRTTSEQMP